ncbi:integrase core domain-containing protein [Gimesia aquarii]|nr:integrase core domain-containing protein [Gimesia aquarii]
MHDRNGKQTKKFTETLQQSRIKTNTLPIVSPNRKGRCERFIETIKLEYWAKFIVFGKQHLDYQICSFTAYYNTLRSHTTHNYQLPIREIPDEVEKLLMGEVQVIAHIGGLIKSFKHIAA